MFINILIGILIALIFCGTTFFIVKVYSKNLKLNKTTTRISFFVLIIAPILFLGSFALRQNSDWMTQDLYTFIQTISGFAFYIFLGSVLLAAILFFGYLFKKNIPTFVGIFILTISLGVGFIGLYQAQNIKTTYFKIHIPHLPENFIGKKAVLVSDTHFGLVNQEIFSDKVVDKILKENPDFVMHAGDFYDGPTISLRPITESWKRLANKIPVFYAPGNHEEYGESYGAFIASIRNAGVNVLEDEMIEYEGIQIIGIKYRDGKDPVDIRDVLKEMNLDETKPSIIINHPPTGLESANESKIDLQVSGHTHNGQMWPMNYIVKSIYGDQTYGLSKYKNLQILTTRGVGTFGPPFRTFNQAEIMLIEFVR